MIDILQIVGSLGVGAFLGALIFIMYRTDRKDTENRIHDVHNAHSERLASLLDSDKDAREENTKALTELVTLLRRMNGRS